MTICLIHSKERMLVMNQDVNVLALLNGRERYIFFYNDESRAEALCILGRFASNPELSFTWYDAAVLSQKIRQEEEKSIINNRFSGVSFPDV